MNKKIKKYISGSMIAVLLLMSMPLQTVANVNPDNGGNVADVEQEASSNNNGDVENILDGADDDDKIIVDDTLENNAAIEKDFLQDRDVEGPDSEDITEEFTDPAFRALIRAKLNLDVSEPITRSACANIKNLALFEQEGEGLGIKSLAGIKYLVNLTGLNCNDNQLTSLDMSGCANLTDLMCLDNELTSLDVSGCSNLTFLNCSDNQLRNLNISGCHNLTELYCSGNELPSLDVSGCATLTTLHCGGNKLPSLDISGCPNLTRLYCYKNQLPSLDISGYTNLTELSCGGNQLSNLDVSGFYNLTSLNCEDNQLGSLNVSGFSKLTTLSCGGNQLSSLDVSDCVSLTMLFCNDNALSDLDVSDCANLTRLACGGNQLGSLNVSGCDSLTQLFCKNNTLSSLNVNGCINLTYLNCSENNMKSPDDIKGRTQEFDGTNFIFYPQKNINIPITPTASPTSTPPKEKKPQNPTVTPKSITLYMAGNAKALKVSKAKGKVTYISSDPKVAKVDSKGKVMPKSAGKTIVTIKISGDSSYKPAIIEIAVSVKKNAQSPTVNHKSLQLYAKGKSKALKVSKARGKVTYKSSNPKVAKVDAKGKVTPKSAGKATVTVKISGDNSYKPAVIKVAVSVKKNAQSPTVSHKSLQLYAGGSETLKVYKAKGKVTYKSNNPNVAKVNAKGEVISKAPGKSTIVIKIAGNSSYKAATVKVKVIVYKNPADIGGFLELYKQKKYAEARAQAQKLPSKAKEGCVKDMSDEIKAAYRKKVDFYRESHNYEDDPWLWDYFLTDMNKDCVPELMIRYGTCEADVKSVFYAYKNGKAVKIGSQYISHAGFYAYPDGNGLIVQTAHMGYETLKKISFFKGKVTMTEIGQCDVGNGSYMKVPYQLKSHYYWDREENSGMISYDDLY